jgi:hypothetical protein
MAVFMYLTSPGSSPLGLGGLGQYTLPSPNYGAFCLNQDISGQTQITVQLRAFPSPRTVNTTTNAPTVALFEMVTGNTLASPSTSLMGSGNAVTLTFNIGTSETAGNLYRVRIDAYDSSAGQGTFWFYYYFV